MARKMTCTMNITVPLVKGSVSFTGGDEVEIDKLPTSAVEQMSRLGQLVETEDYKAEESSVEPDEGDEDDWRDAPIEGINLKDSLVAALQDAGLGTIREVLVFADSNAGDLTKIKGVGEASASEIQAALLKAKPTQ